MAPPFSLGREASH